MNKLDLTGNQYGYWYVLGRAEAAVYINLRTKKSYSFEMWKCRCKCGIEKVVRGTTLLHGHSRSCGCSQGIFCSQSTKKFDNYAFRYLFSLYKSAARKRAYSWDLTDKEFLSLIIQTCHYCGSPPSNICNKRGSTFLYNGIDRVDNSKGYNLENGVPCCRRCNRAKDTMSKDTFLSHCEQIVKHNKLH